MSSEKTAVHLLLDYTLITKSYYHIAQEFDGESFDKLIVAFKGETLRDKGL